MAFLAVANSLEGILAVEPESVPDESLRLAVGNGDEGICFLPVGNFLDGIFAMAFSLSLQTAIGCSATILAAQVGFQQSIQSVQTAFAHRESHFHFRSPNQPIVQPNLTSGLEADFPKRLAHSDEFAISLVITPDEDTIKTP